MWDGWLGGLECVKGCLIVGGEFENHLLEVKSAGSTWMKSKRTVQF